MISLGKRALAEGIGTFWLVFGGCGAAVLACGAPNHGIGYLGVSLAFGLTVLTMAFAIGHISGCHLNPAVTLGLAAAGRFKGGKDIVAYICAQIIGGVIAGYVLFYLANQPEWHGIGSFATNGWSYRPDEVTGLNAFGGTLFGPQAAFAIEAILTAVFLFVIIGSTDRRAPAGLAPIAIGLCLTLIHLISIPATNTSVNPARSIATALPMGPEAMGYVPLFIIAPIVGAVIAGYIYKYFFENEEEKCCCCECKCDKEDDKKEECKKEECKCDKKEVKEKCKKEECKCDKKEDKKDVKEEKKEDKKDVKEEKKEDKKDVKDDKKEEKKDDKKEDK